MIHRLATAGLLAGLLLGVAAAARADGPQLTIDPSAQAVATATREAPPAPDSIGGPRAVLVAPIAPAPTLAPAPAPVRAVRPAPAPASGPRPASQPRPEMIVVAFGGHITHDVCAYRFPCYKAGEQVWVATNRPQAVNGTTGWLVTGSPYTTLASDVLPADAVSVP